MDKFKYRESRSRALLVSSGQHIHQLNIRVFIISVDRREERYLSVQTAVTQTNDEGTDERHYLTGTGTAKKRWLNISKASRCLPEIEVGFLLCFIRWCIRWKVDKDRVIINDLENETN